MTEEKTGRWQVSGVAAMHDFAALHAESLCGGEVLALCGSLGAGKTHFTQGLARGLGIDPAAVTSPTFTLVNEYGGGRLPLYHFDFYRLDAEDELLAIGWEEYLDEPGIVVAEWADKFPHLLPAGTQWWNISAATATATATATEAEAEAEAEADEQASNLRTLRLGEKGGAA